MSAVFRIGHLGFSAPTHGDTLQGLQILGRLIAAFSRGTEIAGEISVLFC